jgi:hypothetical protein
MTHEKHKHKRRRRQNPVEHRADGVSILELQSDRPGDDPMFCFIDTADYDRVKDICWQAHHASQRVYARARARASIGNRRPYRHSLLLPDATVVNNFNQDGLDNRRRNLRPATQSQSHGTLSKRTDRIYTSEFKGVNWDKNRSRWMSRIKDIHVGRFEDEEEAARARDAVAIKLYGEFAYLNFPATATDR